MAALEGLRKRTNNEDKISLNRALKDQGRILLILIKTGRWFGDIGKKSFQKPLFFTVLTA